MEARLEAIAELLRSSESGQLRRHSENKDRLERLREEMERQGDQIRELQRWQSYVKGITMAWALGWSFFFTAVAEIVRNALGKH